jgi:hypothetical protein
MFAFEVGIGVLGALAISMLLGFAAAFGMTLTCWHRTRQVRRRAIAGHCHRCDYDLQFRGLSRGCPECGWRRNRDSE